MVAEFDLFIQKLQSSDMDANVYFFYPSQRRMSNFYDKKAYYFSGR